MPFTLDCNNNRVYRLATPRIIRRPVRSPSSADGSFWFNLILSNRAFRDMSVACVEDKKYFQQCVRLGIIKDQEELEQHLQEYASYKLWDTLKLNSLKDRIDLDLPNMPVPGPQVVPGTQEGNVHGATADDLLLGIQAMQMIAEEQAGLEEGTQPFDPVRQLFDILSHAGPPVADPNQVDPETKLHLEALARCTPQLLQPLHVEYAGLMPKQQRAVAKVEAELEAARAISSMGAGSPSARPRIVSLQGGPGRLCCMHVWSRGVGSMSSGDAACLYVH